MKILTSVMTAYLLLILTACLGTANNNSEPDKVTEEGNSLSKEETIKRQQQVFAKASAAPREFREGLKENCPHFNSILLTTADTIQLGTRVFNAGGISLTNRIYEGTVYKILFTIENECMELSDALQAGIAMANNEESHHDKAWALRNALDLIIGGPPLKPPGG